MAKIGKHLFLILFLISAIIANFGIPVFSYASFAFAVFQMVFYTDEQNFYFGCFLMPMLGIFDITGVTYLPNILVAVPLVMYILRGKFRFKTFPVIATAVLFIVELIHMAVLNNLSNLLQNVSTFLSMFYCLSILLDDQVDLKLKNICHSLSAGIFASSVIFMLSTGMFNADIVDNVIGGQRFAAYTRDPNYFSLYICLAVAMLFTLKKHRALDYIFLVALTAFGLLTASRMCFILLVFIAVVGILYNSLKINNRARSNFAVGTVAVLGVSIFIFRDSVYTLFQNLLDRSGISSGISNIDMTQLTAGRTDIVADYLNILSSNITCLTVGYGLQYHKYLTAFHGAGAHNTYLDIVLAWGILGAAIMLIVVFVWVTEYRKIIPREKDFISWLPFVVLLLNLFDLSCLSATMFWWVLAIAISALKKQETTDLTEEKTLQGGRL